MHSSRPPLRELGEADLLRLVAEDRGTDLRRAAWGELVERDIDRVRALVSLWRLKGAGVRIAFEDREDAIQWAFLRLLRMLDSFRGTGFPEYRAAMATCVDYACRDFSRRRMRQEMRSDGSLDDTTGEGEGPYETTIAAVSADREAALAEAREMLDQLARRIDGLPSENMRAVTRLTIEGYSSR